MSKKFHAVCVGRKPGLYAEWSGPNGAEAQISRLKNYPREKGNIGILSCNDLEEAIRFLRTNPLRVVQFSFHGGNEITFDEMVAACPFLAAQLSKAPARSTPAIPSAPKVAPSAPPQPAASRLDPSRILRAPVSDQVHRFCARHGFSHLSEDQRRAVQAVDGKYLLFAVPGSGKTTVMMARAGYMVHACGIPASELMTMTFTRASAKEMQDRYRRCFPDDAESAIPAFRTIHSFCMGVVIKKLRKAGFVCPDHVINEAWEPEVRRDEDGKEAATRNPYAQRAILSAVLKKNGIRSYSDEAVQDMVQAAFSGIKNRRMTEDEYCRYTIHIDKTEHPLAPLYKSYQELLKELDCMDYDDMLVLSLHGLRENPQVLREICSIYKYWSIDEAQDNSRIQNDLLDLLCAQDGNLFMVGDDDQSIYSFRGAAPNMLLDYGNRPDVHPLLMGTNYRSHRHIVEAAKAFVEHNRCRADKQMHTQHQAFGLISIPQSFRNEARQYAYIDQAAKVCQQQGKRLGVLYQLNASAFPLVVHMHRAGIPFEASRGLTELRKTKIIGRLLRILRFADTPTDLRAFLACRKDLGLYAENETLKKQLEAAHRSQPETPVLQLILDLFQDDDKHRADFQKAHHVLTRAAGKAPADALTVILQGLADRLSPETLSERLYLYGVLSVCDLYPTLREMFAGLDAMEKQEKHQRSAKDDDALADETDSTIATNEKTVVSLSTIHSAKGREWDYVILIDSFNEVFPGEPRPDHIGFDPEEASRVFYVAVTRAIERLDILTTDAYHGNIEPVSSFISRYAYEADRIVDHSVQHADVPEEAITGALCKLESGKFYSVPFGPKPGVYTLWEDVEQQKRGLPIPPELQPRKHATFAEAWERVFPGEPLPESDRDALNNESIRQYIQTSGGPAFNHAIDIPQEVQQGLLEHLHTASLQALPADRRQRLIEQSRFDWRGSRTDYHGRTDGYAAAYMSVNFYKIWLPLWKLLIGNKLPAHPEILEIGPGPGTSTWSLIEFYRKLAAANPHRQFSLHYTAVEIEPDFSALFHTIKRKVLASLPENLTVQLTLHTARNAFDYMNAPSGNGVDLLIESNVLNVQEDFSSPTREAFLSGLRKHLHPGGYALLVEPRENLTPSDFAVFISSAVEQHHFSAWCPASNAAVYVGGIRLFRDAINAHIRYSLRAEHWFSYAILTRKEEEGRP